MSRKKQIAILGCGIFGAMIALRLSENGFGVTVFEKELECLRGASFNNQNRLHLGFHYPRDVQTAKQCVRGFSRFCEEFSECIVSGFPNLYFIAQQGSHIDANVYKNFCASLDVEYELIANDDLPVEVLNVSQAIRCREVVYDCNILRSSILKKIIFNIEQVIRCRKFMPETSLVRALRRV